MVAPELVRVPGLNKLSVLVVRGEGGDQFLRDTLQPRDVLDAALHGEQCQLNCLFVVRAAGSDEGHLLEGDDEVLPDGVKTVLGFPRITGQSLNSISIYDVQINKRLTYQGGLWYCVIARTMKILF